MEAGLLLIVKKSIKLILTVNEENQKAYTFKEMF